MPPPNNTSPDKFPKDVRDRERRKLRSLRQEKQVWFGLGMFGLVGWSVAVPAVVATFIGLWIDRQIPGRYSWTLMLFIAGLCLGCYNAWYWLQKERQAIGRDRRDDDDA